MSEIINPICRKCDYALACHKKVGGEFIKSQTKRLPKCLCIVQDICRDCTLFRGRRCASWKQMNGKDNGGVLDKCPKKVKISE